MGYSIKIFSVEQLPIVRESYFSLMIGAERLSHIVTTFGSLFISGVEDMSYNQ